MSVPRLDHFSFWRLGALAVSLPTVTVTLRREDSDPGRFGPKATAGARPGPGVSNSIDCTTSATPLGGRRVRRPPQAVTVCVPLTGSAAFKLSVQAGPCARRRCWPCQPNRPSCNCNCVASNLGLNLEFSVTDLCATAGAVCRLVVIAARCC